MQTSDSPIYRDISDHPERIEDNGVIFAKASLAKKLLEDMPNHNKFFIGIPETHNAPLSDPDYLAEQIKRCL